MKKKFNIHHILIPYDFSETAAIAVEHAIFMAKLHKAKITLLNVISTQSFLSGLSSSFGKAKTDYETNVESELKQKLDKLAQDIHQKDGNEVVVLIKKGKIYKEIINTAEEIACDIIIMGTHGSGGHQEKLSGTNTLKTVISSPCPVISVQTHATRVGFKNIVVPVDNTLVSRQKVRYAVEVARHYNSVLHFIGVMTAKKEEAQRMFEVKVKQAMYWAEDHGAQCTMKIVKGEQIAKETLQYEEEIKADLAIVMTEQEGSIGMFGGSDIQQMINNSKIPVMSIRPDKEDPDKISVGY
jgi:nucleotide-binding universal stress UspA family protein